MPGPVDSQNPERTTSARLCAAGEAGGSAPPNASTLTQTLSLPGRGRSGPHPNHPRSGEGGYSPIRSPVMCRRRGGRWCAAQCFNPHPDPLPSREREGRAPSQPSAAGRGSIRPSGARLCAAGEGRRCATQCFNPHPGPLPSREREERAPSQQSPRRGGGVSSPIRCFGVLDVREMSGCAVLDTKRNARACG